MKVRKILLLLFFFIETLFWIMKISSFMFYKIFIILILFFIKCDFDFSFSF